MDPFTSPEPAASSLRRQLRGPVAVATLIVVMVVVSIAGSVFWRPAPIDRVTLELGGPAPVGLDSRAPDETISRVLDLVGPTVAFLVVPEAGRSGSGVVVHEAGFVVTNAHVVEGFDELRVVFDDGAEYTARVYGVDTSTDLAVVKLDTDELLRPAALGDSDALQVGEFVLALGAPFGLAASATSGIVSGLHRDGLGIARYEDFIVTDAPINRGNSGGPLVNLRGEVVGINTAIIAGEEDAHGMGGFAGVGFAIPVNVMRVVAQRLIGDGGLVPSTPDASRGAGDEAGAAVLDPESAPFTVAGPWIGAPSLAPEGQTSVAGSAVVDPAKGPLAESVAFVQSFNGRGRSVAKGTGFVVDSEIGNLLLTNAHVVVDAERVAVFFPGERLMGTVLAADDSLELALVSLPGGEGRLPLEVVGSGDVEAGHPVTHWAARLSEDRTVEVVANPGNVTATGLQIRRLADRATLIETDATILQGDSGGPLLDVAGSVVGVTVARDRRNDSTESARRSFAIELYLDGNVAGMKSIAADPGFEDGVQAAYLPDRPYIIVTTLEPDSPLIRAGLEPRDRIMSINDEPFDSSPQVRREQFLAFKRLEPGTRVKITVSRAVEGGGDQRRDIEIPFVVPNW